ncbi:ankyrin repeat domain-containing protein [Legionella sp. CNM-4043-24]|uniref:ankyrin repeat domain-containing protein n=1 Tax=Legionella sp. CNM-4043-24 TaxID=3421646 RepID=UPI00403AF5E4
MPTEWKNLLTQLNKDADAVSGEDVAALLADDPCIPRADLDGLSPMHYAALHGYDRCLRYLLRSHPAVQDMVNYPSAAGMTPLHLATLGGDENTVALLLEHGADPRLKNKLGQTTLHTALTFLPGDKVRDKAKKTAIFNLLRSKDTSLIRVTDLSGNTVAHQMVLDDFDELLAELAQSDARDLLLKPNFFGRTPLHVAIINNHAPCVAVLTRIPACLLVSDSNRRLPLHYAAQKGSLMMFRSCLPPGKEALQKDDYGLDARAIAEQNKRDDIVACLDEIAQASCSC